MCHQGYLALGSLGVTGGDGLNVEKRQGDRNGWDGPGHQAGLLPFSKAGLMLTFPGDLALDWA